MFCAPSYRRELREVRLLHCLCDMHTSTGNQEFFLGSVVAVMVMVACLFAPHLATHGGFDLTGSIASRSAP